MVCASDPASAINLPSPLCVSNLRASLSSIGFAESNSILNFAVVPRAVYVASQTFLDPSLGSGWMSKPKEVLLAT